MAKCISCESRKGKRNCPAMGSVICNKCCGTKKGKEIDCPEDCFYLLKSKQYFTDRQEAQRISNFEQEMKSVIGDEDRYLDILQNIEFIIYQTYIEKGNIDDRDVEIALDYMMEMGKAQLDLPSKFLTRLPTNIQHIVDAIDDIFEIRDSLAENKEIMMNRLKCIYRVLDSVRTHYEPDDNYSYLHFIGQFIKEM